MSRPFYLLCILLLGYCVSVSQTKTQAESDLQIVYTVNGKGLFLYDVKSGQDKKIYDSSREFLKGLSFINDSIILVAHRDPYHTKRFKHLIYSKYFHKPNGDSLWMTDNPPFTLVEERQYLSEFFFAVNVNDASHYSYKTIDYEADFPNGDTLRIKTTFFDPSGKVNLVKDTVVYSSHFHSGSDINYLYVLPKETVNGKEAFSRNGNLYVADQKDTSLFLNFGGVYDSEYGNGYHNPALSPDGKRVAFESSGDTKSGSGLYEITVQSKKQIKLAGDAYYYPLYSPDGQTLLLFKENKKYNQQDYIYVLDITTGKLKKIRQGNDYRWRPQRQRP